MVPPKKNSPRSRGAQLARKARQSRPKTAGTVRKNALKEEAVPVLSCRDTLRVGFIPGVEPDVFARRWETGTSRPPLQLVPLDLSEQASALHEGHVDMVFARLPLLENDGDGRMVQAHPVHVVKLWEEKPVVVMGIEHELVLHDEVEETDLADVHEFPAQEPGDEKSRIDVVATGIGITRMPMSLARLHRRKDATYRVINGAPGGHIALVWLVENDDEVCQEFVAVARGRTARSGR